MNWASGTGNTGENLPFIWGTSKKDHKCFDIAYDTYTGNALVFGYNDNQKGIVMYTVWDGSNWMFPAQAFDTGGGKEIRYIDAKGSPTSGEILIAVLDKDKDITLHRWDGTSFAQLAILETDAAEDEGMKGKHHLRAAVRRGGYRLGSERICRMQICYLGWFES